MDNFQKPYFSTMPSMNTIQTCKAQSSRYQQNNTVQSYYETLLFNNQSKSTSKLVETKSPNKPTKNVQSMTSDKFLILQLQQQIIDLKNQVEQLTVENQKLKNKTNESLDKIRGQYYQMTKYSKVLKQIHQIKIENIQLRQEVQLFKKDLSIQFSPLKQLINQLLNHPKNDIIEIQQLNSKYLQTELSMELNRGNLLSEDRSQLQLKCFEQEDYINQLLEQIKQLRPN